MGAVLFASTTTSLSWSKIDDRHWSAPALWYGAVLMALIAVVLGAHHTMMLPELSATTSNFSTLRKKPRGNASAKDDVRPGRISLFSMHTPLMCLTYSIIFFLVGLASFVIGPLVMNPRWNADVKVRCRIWKDVDILIYHRPCFYIL